MLNFYSVMLNFAGTAADIHEKIETTLDAIPVQDWLRFGNYQYIVATDRTVTQLYDAVKPHIPSGGYILVMAVDINERKGWASETVVNWIKKHAP